MHAKLRLGFGSKMSKVRILSPRPVIVMENRFFVVLADQAPQAGAIVLLAGLAGGRSVATPCRTASADYSISSPLSHSGFSAHA